MLWSYLTEILHRVQDSSLFIATWSHIVVLSYSNMAYRVLEFTRKSAVFTVIYIFMRVNFSSVESFKRQWRNGMFSWDNFSDTGH